MACKKCREGEIRISSEWVRSGRGVYSEFNSEQQATAKGRELLNEAYFFLNRLEKIPCLCKFSDLDLVPVFYWDFKTTVNGYRWRMYISIVNEKSCILSINPIYSAEEEINIESQCKIRAEIWSSHCDRYRGEASKPMNLSQFLREIEELGYPVTLYDQRGNKK